jgi:hypothetical protein
MITLAVWEPSGQIAPPAAAGVVFIQSAAFAWSGAEKVFSPALRRLRRPARRTDFPPHGGNLCVDRFICAAMRTDICNTRDAGTLSIPYRGRRAHRRRLSSWLSFWR